jgi:hypothetical protein
MADLRPSGTSRAPRRPATRPAGEVWYRAGVTEDADHHRTRAADADVAPDRGTPSHLSHEAHMHVHVPGCGHALVAHDDHADFVHGRHRHAAHGTHYDEH